MTANPGQISCSAPHCTSAAPSARRSVPSPAPQPTAARLFISVYKLLFCYTLALQPTAPQRLFQDQPYLLLAVNIRFWWRHYTCPTPLKKINPKCHAHRLPVSIFEIGNMNFVGFHLLCRSECAWKFVLISHGAKRLDLGTRFICSYKYRFHLIWLNHFNQIL